MESVPPRILLLSRSKPALALLPRVAESLGATVCAGSAPPVPPGKWCLVCADEAAVGSVGGLRAGRAVAEGAADVLGLPLWEPEIRARPVHWIPGPAPQRDTESLTLRKLLEAQQELIPLQVPHQIVTRVREGLRHLFP